jgi:hypothetical protein
MRDGCINLERLARNPSPFLARRVVERAHVVRPVRQLDQNDAHVTRHGEQHLAEGLGLIFFARVEPELVQLGETVDELCDRCTEAFYQLRLGHAAILDGVVQQSGHQGLRIELPFGALRRHCDRMRDVGLAAVAQLSQVRFVGEAVGAAHLFDVFGAQIVEAVGQRGETGGSRIQRRRARPGRASGGIGMGLDNRAHGFTLAWQPIRRVQA